MNFDDLKLSAKKIGISLSDYQVDQLDKYASFLLETNKVMNLTAIKTLDDVIEKHFYDSMLISTLADLSSVSLLDIGTGAGFPGIIIAILFPNAKVTLLDATAKKIKFLQNLSSLIGLNNVEFINARIEDLNKQKETFDFVTARAFSSLPTLIEVGIPMLKVHGHLIAMKSAKAEEELSESKSALMKLESKVTKISHEVLPFSKEIRVNILIEKCSPSAKRFPRQWSEIISKPL